MRAVQGLAALLLVALWALAAGARETGRMVGRVVDAQSKQPLAGAFVRILGTERGAVADEGGPTAWTRWRKGCTSWNSPP